LPTGELKGAVHFDRRGGGSPSDQAPPRLPKLDLATVLNQGDEPFTVPADGPGHAWRVRVAPFPDGGGSELVAISLDDVDGPVEQLAWAETAIGGAVLLLLGLLAYVVVRSSLRGLVAVEHTAEAIAAGDLTQRVPPAHPSTEVGRLSNALNAMLGQIESAFETRRASEEAARASESRMRRFVADASHELRTPLTSIRGFAELYRDRGGADPDANQVIGRIEHHAVRMGTLVDDLLLLARLDQQRPLERRPVDLLALATDAVVDGRATAPDHPLRLVTTGGEDDPPPVVVGDETRLRQVVANLLANAFTHTPAGTEVTVSVGTEDGMAVLEVADTGRGISPQDAERVFERFYRTDPSRARTHGGAGLGLSIVAALVAAHHGEVSVTTAPGAGARFEVRLPLA
jgi:two-component system OmpR family sensor kinase